MDIAASVLFIGNSLTAGNDLPRMVAGIAAADGKRLRYEARAVPNASLEDHLAAPRALRAIHRGGWGAVVLQQGPSTLPASRAVLIRDARLFADEVRRSGARPALLMVWPVKGGSFDAVSGSYREAATKSDSLIIPAGDAWRIALRMDASLPLYSVDGFHPAPAGSYLAALTAYRALFDRLPSPELALKTLALTAAQVKVLHDAATEAVAAPRGRPRDQSGMTSERTMSSNVSRRRTRWRAPPSTSASAARGRMLYVEAMEKA
jgi:hypothetical protein